MSKRERKLACLSNSALLSSVLEPGRLPVGGIFDFENKITVDLFDAHGGNVGGLKALVAELKKPFLFINSIKMSVLQHALASHSSAQLKRAPLHTKPRRKPCIVAAVDAPQSENQQGQLKGGVSIRRRPPLGRETQPCGSLQMRVTGMPEENKPRNILEEIVW
eukprot:1147751-Pelagomonas_calceolata.AAC.4